MFQSESYTYIALFTSTVRQNTSLQEVYQPNTSLQEVYQQLAKVLASGIHSYQGNILVNFMGSHSLFFRY